MTDLTRHYRQLLGMARTWAMKTVPGWSDDSHRDLLAMAGATMAQGRISATTMTIKQLDAALRAYEARGWERRCGVYQSGRVVRAVPARIAKMVRMWAVLAEEGKSRDGSRRALLAWCSRQTGQTVTRLDDLEPELCQKLTEQLKQWQARTSQARHALAEALTEQLKQCQARTQAER